MTTLYLVSNLRTKSQTCSFLSAFFLVLGIVLEMLLLEEVGMPAQEDDNYSPVRAGAITTLAFMAFGCIPLLSFVLPFSALSQVVVSVSVALCSFFALGAIKGKYLDIGQSWWHSGLVIGANGSFAACIAYVVGFSMHTLAKSSNFEHAVAALNRP